MSAKRLQIYALTVTCAGILIFAAFFGAWEGAPLRTPSEGQNTEGDQQKSRDKQPAREPSRPTVTENTSGAEATSKNDTAEPSNQWFYGWTSSDKIAAVASLAALLQFIVLIITVSVMRGTASRQLRAYVLVKDNGIDEIRFGDFPKANVNIQNFGQTPAYKVSCWCKVGIREYPLARPLPEKTNSAVFQLGPGATFFKSVAMKAAISYDNDTEISEGREAIYVWGRINYTDAFKRRRFTNFRFAYRGHNLNGVCTLEPCDEGNDSD